jgi:peroxiredoxin-like protein
MPEIHHFELQSQLIDQTEGNGKLFLSTGTIDYGVPPQFGGTAGKASPEELILAAISSCFSMTLGFVLEKRKIPITSLEMHAECEVDRIERQLHLASITLKPRITVKEDNDQIRQDIKAAIERAERACVISNAVRGNVKIVVEEEVRS